MEEKKWLVENFSPYKIHKHQIKEELVDTQTKFQKAVLANLYELKNCLVLDGELQSAELDEFIYHESLVHPGMLTHPNPENVLILGGGEGATLREALKHKSVKKVVMVDIDGQVVEFCKKHLSMFHQGAFDDPRTELVVGDALEYVNNTDQKFDVIISDLCCPLEESPAKTMYTKEFYATLITKLTDNGIFALQAASGSLTQIQVHASIGTTLKQVFANVESFYSFVPAYDVPWAFIVATKNKQQSAKNLTREQVDKMLQERVNGELRFYDGITHQGIFSVPKYLRKILNENKNVITNDKPCYLYK